jgi:hypothetical protein
MTGLQNTRHTTLAGVGSGQANPRRELMVVALVVAAAGFIAQMIAGVTSTPTIPPGLVAIVAAAALVAFTSSPSAPLAGVAAGVFNLLAFLIVGAVDRLADTAPLLAFLGAWLMVLGLIVSSVIGTIAALHPHRRPRSCNTGDPAGPGRSRW